MNSVVLTLVVVLSMSHRQAEGSIPCDQLPKEEVHGFDVLTVNSPYVYDYTLTPLFDCSTKVFANPARGPTHYSGTALSIRGSDITAFDVTVAEDNKAMHATRCSTGESSTWYSLGGQVDDSGAFFCLYTCKGPLLGEFVCGSTNNGTSEEELEAVKLAKTVSNGDQIHDAKENCPARIGCNAF